MLIEIRRMNFLIQIIFLGVNLTLSLCDNELKIMTLEKLVDLDPIRKNFYNDLSK